MPSGADRALLDLLLAAYVVTQIFDAWTTWVIVGQQGGRERNGWLAWLIDRIGLVPTLLLAKGISITAGAYLYAVEQSALALIILTALYAWQGWQNWVRVK